MKKAKNIEKIIKDTYNDKLQVTANPAVDKKVLTNAVNALEELQSRKSVDIQTNVLIIIAKNRIVQIATAAVIVIVAIFLFFMHKEQVKEFKTQQITHVTKSPAELTTVASLTFAYRQGGMERVEQICDRAVAMTGPQLANVSLQDLFEDFNGKIQKGQIYEK